MGNCAALLGHGDRSGWRRRLLISRSLAKMMLDFFADGELQVALDTDHGEEEDRVVTLFGVTFQVRGPGARAHAHAVAQRAWTPLLTVSRPPVPASRVPAGAASARLDADQPRPLCSRKHDLELVRGALPVRPRAARTRAHRARTRAQATWRGAGSDKRRRAPLPATHRYLEAGAEGHAHEFAAEALRGKRVLELGAGCAGLSGLCLACMGCAQVVLTDQAEVLPLLRENVSRFLSAAQALPEGSLPHGCAALTGAISVEEFDWLDPSQIRAHAAQSGYVLIRGALALAAPAPRMPGYHNGI